MGFHALIRRFWWVVCGLFDGCLVHTTTLIPLIRCVKFLDDFSALPVQSILIFAVAQSTLHCLVEQTTTTRQHSTNQSFRFALVR